MATMPERMASMEAHMENIRTKQDEMYRKLNEVHACVLLDKGENTGRHKVMSRYNAAAAAFGGLVGGIGVAITAALAFANRYLPATHDISLH